MTNEQAQAYLKSGAGVCPECGSSDISGGSIGINGESAHQECFCSACDAEWTDCYHLAGVIDSEGNIYDREVPEEAPGIYKIFDCSTTYITKQDDENLKHDLFPHTCYPYEQGYFVHSGKCYIKPEEANQYVEETIYQFKEFGMSEAFIKVWKHAADLGCWFLRLDCDGMEHEEFEKFNDLMEDNQ